MPALPTPILTKERWPELYLASQTLVTSNLQPGTEVWVRGHGLHLRGLQERVFTLYKSSKIAKILFLFFRVLPFSICCKRKRPKADIHLSQKICNNKEGCFYLCTRRSGFLSFAKDENRF